MKRHYQLTELTPQACDVLNSSHDWQASNLTYNSETREVKSFGIRIAYARGRGWSWINEGELIDEIQELNGYQNSAFRRHHSIIRTLIKAYNKRFCVRPPESDELQAQLVFPTAEPNTPLADTLPEVTQQPEPIEETDEVTTTPIPALNDAIIDFIMKLTDTIELFNQTIRKEMK